jgi:hypothetical protein
MNGKEIAWQAWKKRPCPYDECRLSAPKPCTCSTHPNNAPLQVGLLWVGKQFYKTPQKFVEEALKMGISRRIPAIPKDFVIGETWVWLAYRELIWGIVDGKEVVKAGVFCSFLPDQIEYIVKEDDSSKKLERLEKRGVTLVRLVEKEHDYLPNIECESNEKEQKVADL